MVNSKYRFMRLFVIMLPIMLALITASNCEKRVKDNPISCSERAKYRGSNTSDYILPYPAGKTYILSQGYCNANGGHSNQLAYDFAMSIGDTVCCIRSGFVKELRENQPDSGGTITASNHNYLMIMHEDGTVAFYAHLMQNGVLVEIGDFAEQGERIALSGNSGNTLNFPHLHLGLYENYPPQETYDLPIIFKNIAGPTDSLGGLIVDERYTALKSE
jgi:murein DD-endopeptidase MepM/ murein hydrolase activator NlpD